MRETEIASGREKAKINNFKILINKLMYYVKTEKKFTFKNEKCGGKLKIIRKLLNTTYRTATPFQAHACLWKL